MHADHEHRLKRELAEILAILLLSIFCTFVLLHMNLGGHVEESEEYFVDFRPEARPLSPSELSIINKYRNKPEPITQPSGTYTASFHDADTEMTIQYIFPGEGIVVKEISFQGITLIGKAQYSFNGSTISYSFLSGDKSVFPDEGEALIVGDRDIALVVGYSHEGDIQNLEDHITFKRLDDTNSNKKITPLHVVFIVGIFFGVFIMEFRMAGTTINRPDY